MKILVKTRFIETTKNIQQYLNSEYSSELSSKFTNALKEKMQQIVKFPQGYPPVRQLPTKKNWYRFALFRK